MYPFSQAEIEARARRDAKEQPRQKQRPRGFLRTTGQLPRRLVRIKSESAQSLLLTALLDGPRSARDIFEIARSEKLSEAGIRRAKRQLKIRSIRCGGIAHKGRWMWLMPADKSL